MQLIVAEKPSVARDLARVLGVPAGGRGPFEGAARVITWCIGHLVELDEPASYDARWKPWRLETLPMLPEAFRLRPSRGSAAQYRVVARLLREGRFREVVNACDAGREGELIFRYLYQLAGCRLPVRRLWISSLTDEAVRAGFAALRPGAAFDALADAARCRSEADWLVGLNATRALTIKRRTGRDSPLLSIGRVQTPTLAMLVARERQIREFVPRDYFEVHADLATAAGERFGARWSRGGQSRLATRDLALAIAGRDQALGHLPDATDPRAPVVERLWARTVKEPPPQLFDLTSLQRTANRRFGFPAARTLEIAQALYERHKLLTYPRTDSRHLTADVARELPALVEALAGLPEYEPFAARLLPRPPQLGRRFVDDGKVSDHHAIIPTGKPARLERLDRDERRLFDLVVRRFFGAFYPDAEIAVTDVVVRVGGGEADGPAEVELPPAERTPGDAGAPRGRPQGEAGRAGGGARGERQQRPDDRLDDRPDDGLIGALPPPPDRYACRGRVRRVAGWQEVAGIDERAARRERPGSDDAGADEAAPPLPPLREGQRLSGDFAVRARRTTPPPRLTEATLLAAMESAGRAIEDEALRDAMRDVGLGTPATRAAIIETLLERAFLEREGKSLVPTPTGMGLIAALPVPSLASPELTGNWEARLARVARGEESRDAFMADIRAYVREAVAAIVASESAPLRYEALTRPAATDEAVARDQAPDDRGVWRPRVDERAPRPARGRRGAGGAAGTRRGSAQGTARNAATGRGAARGGSLRRRGEAEGSTPGALPVDGWRRRPAGPTSPQSPAVGGAHGEARGGPARPSAARGGGVAGSSPRSRVPPALGDLPCPRCRQGRLVTGNRGWGCSRWREGCGFVVWFETAGKRLTVRMLEELVTRGKTRRASYRPDGNAPVEGRLVLDAAGPAGARFVPA